MKKINLEMEKEHLENMRERDFVKKIMDFIKSDHCYYGNILVLYGLKRTGKKTAMKQALLKLPQDVQYAFYELADGDEMSDVEKVLDEEHDRGVTVVCFDEITKAKDFVRHSSVLPDIYAKMGIRIIAAGTDSLCFEDADYGELYGRTYRLNTTHISLAEHCRVLGTNDIDDYIQHGGLMREGTDAKSFVHDYESAREYLDSAIAENLCNGMRKDYHIECMYDLSAEELRFIAKKMVELYSGVLDRKNVQKGLENGNANFPAKKLFEIEADKDIVQKIALEEEDITKDFLKVINADKTISHVITEYMVVTIRNYLLDMKALSSTMKITFFYEENEIISKSRKKEHEIYIVQPTIKYYHLQEEKKFIKEEAYYKQLPQTEKKFVQQRLDEKIKEEMLQQIILFDVHAALPKKRYDVAKTCFVIKGKDYCEYDMLIFDHEKCRCRGFEIAYTTQPFAWQERHLQNEMFREIIDHEYGERESVCVLYLGESFALPSGTIYLNITDFLMSVERYHDMDQVFDELTQDLPVREL
jgi:hypothetical protein